MHISGFNKTIWAIAVLLLAMLKVNAQNTTLEQKSDTIINVVGYFCKNDTMTFKKHHLKQRIEGNDSTLTYDLVDEFMIVVTDSTSSGYRMELIPISYKQSVGGNTIMNRLFNELWEIKKDVHCIFTTDIFGKVQHIENWREIRDLMKKAIPRIIDGLYNIKPVLDSIVSRPQLENMMLIDLSTEENIRETYDELDLLFGAHGKSLNIGQKEFDDVNNGYPQHIIAKVGYTEQEEEGDIEGDYAIITKSVTTIPTEEAMEMGMMGINSTSLIMKDNMADNLNKKRSDMVDIMKNILNGQDITVTQNEYYGFSYNGWPKLCYTEKIIDIGVSKEIEMNLIEWTSRHWNINKMTKEENSQEL